MTILKMTADRFRAGLSQLEVNALNEFILQYLPDKYDNNCKIDEFDYRVVRKLKDDLLPQVSLPKNT